MMEIQVLTTKFSKDWVVILVNVRYISCSSSRICAWGFIVIGENFLSQFFFLFLGLCYGLFCSFKCHDK